MYFSYIAIIYVFTKKILSLFQLQHIEYLLALLGIPVLLILYFYTLNWKKKTVRKIGDEQLIAELIKGYSPKRYKLKFILILLGFSAAVIALAGLRYPAGSTTIKRNGIDVMIALDVSKSMLAQDIQPNRLERAKQLIGRLIDLLPNDRIGIVVFAGKAYLQMPLTGDHAAAKMFLSSASPDMIPTQGTVIGDALKMCYAAFNTKEKKYKSILLISDGEDHDENAVKIARELAGEGIMVNTVGIGSVDGTTITDAATGEAKKDAAGELVITKLNEAMLKNIAVEGNGLYQLFTTSNEVSSQINTQLKGMDKRTITENSSAVYQYYFQWFLAITIILLVIEFFTSERIKTTVSKKISSNIALAKPTKLSQTLGSLFMLMAFIFPTFLFAQKENVLIKKGNEAYADNKFDEAAVNYTKALEANKTSNKAAFNLGNALYKNGKAEEATKAYDEAIANSTNGIDKSTAWYNKGVVLQNNNKLQESIEAYKNALRLNPSDKDALFNLQKAILKQQEEQRKNKEKKQNKQQQKDQQKPPQNKEEQPKPQQSKMTKKEAEEKLKALLQQEKNLQDKLHRAGEASPNKPEKDW
jgi:Ca-activated chloride channel family protein